MFGILAINALVVSFIVPGNLATPAAVSADAGVCKWNYIDMPGSIAIKGDLIISSTTNAYSASEVEKIITTANADTFLVLEKEGATAAARIRLRVSAAKGIIWSAAAGTRLSTAMTAAGYPAANLDVWNLAAAPDDAKFWAMVTGTAGNDAPLNVWVTSDGGATWQDTALNLAPMNYISCIDISPSYGSGRRDIAVGVRRGVAALQMDMYVIQTGGFTGWVLQTWPVGSLNLNLGSIDNPIVGGLGADVVALKFSPTYVGDASLAVVFAANTTNVAVDLGTFYNVALRDLSSGVNNIVGWAFPRSVEMTATGVQGSSPDTSQIVSADLELPADFSGQSASLRRAYVSTDAIADNTGIYRADDTTVYQLMNTTGLYNAGLGKRINSIAYFGTYASGKLLAGEYNGSTCTATVPTWFTDSPTVCPVPCWYPALKPTTGSAICNCGVGVMATGHASVVWSIDGTLAYAATSSLGEQVSTGVDPAQWYSQLDDAAIIWDETAIGISRNNGETWNQIGIIDTYICYFNDVAVTADCQTIFLASVNDDARCRVGCGNFDSVWRATKNTKVAAPFSTAYPLGYFWERVFTHVDATTCTVAQSEFPLLRLPPPGANCDNGMIIGWAAQGTNAMAWSPDWGDYWAMITPRLVVQDFAFMSPTLLYVLNNAGLVQKMPYTGTAWSSAEENVDVKLNSGHMILAQQFGDKQVVAVGAAAGGAFYPASMSVNGGTSFSYIMDQSPTTGNIHVAIDPAFDTNNTWYYGDDSAVGTVYRVTYGATDISLSDSDMMSAANGAAGTNAPHPVGIFGLQTAYTGGALYAAHAPAGGTATVTATSEPIRINVTTALVDGGDGLPEQITVNYLDQTATAGAAPVVALPMNAAVGYTINPLPLAAGDTGVVDLTGIVIGVADATAGVIQVVGTITGTLYGTYTFGGAYADGASFPGTFVSTVAVGNSGVDRTLGPLNGMPKPGVVWDCMFVAPPANYVNGVTFTREPWSLKICGCCTLDTNSKLWALDARNYIPYVTLQGFLWGFEDCLAKKGPALITADGTLIGCDPVSGRAQEVNLCWEQLCVADRYDIEIAKDKDFNIRVLDWASTGEDTAANFLRPVNVLSPCVFFPAGGEVYTASSAIAASGNLECGHAYYWRVQVRSCATGELLRSKWSEIRSFTIKAGLPVRADYYGLKLLAPDNGCMGCPVKPASFSWTPFKETTKYKFVLAKDAAMTQVVTQAEVPTTTFDHACCPLEYSTNYFWRVIAVEPVPSDWSATFSFQTEPKPAAPAAPAEAPATPLWVWVIIAIGAFLIIITLILILKTYRV
jgi:hypothetical protein